MIGDISTTLDPTAIARRAAIAAVLKEHAAIPEQLRNKVPLGSRNTIARWFFDGLLPKLGFGGVYVETIRHEGKQYHRVVMGLPFRTAQFVVTAFGAYHIVRTLAYVAMATHGESCDLELSNCLYTGDVYIPRWATLSVAEQLLSVANANKERVRFAIDHIKQAQLPFLGTDDDEEPKVEAKPTLQ